LKIDELNDVSELAMFLAILRYCYRNISTKAFMYYRREEGRTSVYTEAYMEE